MSTKYGWQSDLHDAEWGTAIWRSVDGREVEVSMVTESPEDSGTNWPDIKCVGEVVEYLRKGKPDLYRTCWYRKTSYPAIQLLPSRTPRKSETREFLDKFFENPTPRKSLADFTFDPSVLCDDPCCPFYLEK